MKITRRNSLLLEVLIAFVIVVLCILPLIYPNMYILQSEQEMIHTVELDHIVNLVYADTLEKLYLNEIPWESIIQSKAIPINAEVIKNCGFGCPSPYTGTMTFTEMKHKPKKIEDKALYLFKITFEFTKPPRNKKFEEKPKKYDFELVIERRT